MSIGKEHLKQIITENNITNVGDIYTLLKDSFKDILQELLEAEMVSRITDKILPEIREWQSRYFILLCRWACRF